MVESLIDLFKGSEVRFYNQIVTKKYADIDACDACKRNKKVCRYFCRYTNKKYIELGEERRKGKNKMKKLKNMLLESTHWFLYGLALGTGFVVALYLLTWVI